MYVVYRWLLAYFKDGVGNSVRVRVKSIFFKIILYKISQHPDIIQNIK